MYGISYGTRVASHYLRRYPGSIRTLILDAVVPPEVSLGPEISQLSQRALDLIFKRCHETSGCYNSFGDLSESTMLLLDSLEKNPMLHEAIENDNFAPLARQSKLQSKSLGTTLATGMHHAIICTEDAPYVNAHSERGKDSYLGDGVVDSLLASCTNWPTGIVDSDFKTPIQSNKPVLILSGEADPITPPAYGEQMEAGLDNALHIVNPHQGHMQSPLGCVPKLMAQFVQTANVTDLSTECLKRLTAPAFFIDANGPLP